MNNLVRIIFHPEFLLRLTRGAFEVVENAIPRDAQVRHVGYDFERGAITLTVEHESFAPVEEGAVIPLAEPPVIRTLASEELLQAYQHRAEKAAQTVAALKAVAP